MSEPDLFVVCKNCSSEVSPYVTECPYCGQRVRKRAPKIERGTPVEEPSGRRRRKPKAAKPPKLGRLRRDEIPGIAPETRPYVTGALVVIALLATIVTATGSVSSFDLGAIYGPVGNEWWRVAASPFVYSNGGYEFVALVVIAIFGTMIERRFGPVALLVTAVLAGAGGAALAVLLEDFPALGGNGIALGLLGAWFVDDRLAARRGNDRENDLIGVYVLAAVLLLVPVAEEDASFFAGLGGAAIGSVIGTAMSPFRP